MKLYLTLQGGVSYVDDPDVQELLAAARNFPCTHNLKTTPRSLVMSIIIAIIKRILRIVYKKCKKRSKKCKLSWLKQYQKNLKKSG